MVFHILNVDDAESILFEQAKENDEFLLCDSATESAPSSPVDGQRWFKPSTKQVFRWNNTLSVWVHVETVVPAASPQADLETQVASVTATVTFQLGIAKKCTAVQLEVSVDAASGPSNGTDKWDIQVTNRNGVLNLRATAFTTNSNDFVAWTRKVITLDQNLAIADGDVITVTFTKNGAIANLGQTRIVLRALPAA